MPTDDQAHRTERAQKQRDERRPFWIAAAVLGLALLVAGVLAGVISDDSPQTRRDTQGQLQAEGGAKPHIIPLPNSGHAPETPGDRGGWQQFMTFAVIFGGIGVVGLLTWHATRRPTSRRRAWLAAAEQPEQERAALTTGPSRIGPAAGRRSPVSSPPA